MPHRAEVSIRPAHRQIEKRSKGMRGVDKMNGNKDREALTIAYI